MMPLCDRPRTDRIILITKYNYRQRWIRYIDVRTWWFVVDCSTASHVPYAFALTSTCASTTEVGKYGRSITCIHTQRRYRFQITCFADRKGIDNRPMISTTDTYFVGKTQPTYSTMIARKHGSVGRDEIRTHPVQWRLGPPATYNLCYFGHVTVLRETLYQMPNWIFIAYISIHHQSSLRYDG